MSAVLVIDSLFRDLEVLEVMLLAGICACPQLLKPQVHQVLVKLSVPAGVE